jgi:hypothetical protein
MNYRITSKRSGRRHVLNQEQLDVFLKHNKKRNYKVVSESDYIRGKRQEQLGWLLIALGTSTFALLQLIKLIN